VRPSSAPSSVHRSRTERGAVRTRVLALARASHPRRPSLPFPRTTHLRPPPRLRPCLRRERARGSADRLNVSSEPVRTAGSSSAPHPTAATHDEAPHHAESGEGGSDAGSPVSGEDPPRSWGAFSRQREHGVSRGERETMEATVMATLNGVPVLTPGTYAGHAVTRETLARFVENFEALRKFPAIQPRLSLGHGTSGQPAMGMVARLFVALPALPASELHLAEGPTLLAGEWREASIAERPAGLERAIQKEVITMAEIKRNMTAPIPANAGDVSGTDNLELTFLSALEG